MLAYAVPQAFAGFKPFPGPQACSALLQPFPGPHAGTASTRVLKHALIRPRLQHTASPWLHAFWKSRHCLHAHSIHNSYLHCALQASRLPMYPFPCMKARNGSLLYNLLVIYSKTCEVLHLDNLDTWLILTHFVGTGETLRKINTLIFYKFYTWIPFIFYALKLCGILT